MGENGRWGVGVRVGGGVDKEIRGISEERRESGADYKRKERVGVVGGRGCGVGGLSAGEVDEIKGMKYEGRS